VAVPEGDGVALRDVVGVPAEAYSACAEALGVCTDHEILVVGAEAAAAYLTSFAGWSGAAWIFVVGMIGCIRTLASVVRLIATRPGSGLWCFIWV
jgi:hypothetical protein